MNDPAHLRAPPRVVATKLRPPPPRAAAPPRGRLLERLRRERARVVRVVAPAGFGKSTLLAHWATQDDRRFGWVSLDDRDNAPTRFWAHVVAALEPMAPSFAAQAGAALASPRPPDADALVPELVNALDGAGPVALVLDDYQVIERADVHAGVAYLIDHLPVGATLAFGSRTQPPLPLARLRGRGEVLDIDVDALRASPEEARSFLADAMGLALGAADVERLQTRTEGWFAGLQLAALALRGREHDAAAVASFGGDHRLVLEYLTEEVLRGLDPDTTAFLLDTWPLRRLTADTCDALLGRQDSAALLHRLEMANLFVVPLDDAGTTYRYHALFAELLEREALARDRARVRELHARAATWFRQLGDVDELLHHARAAAALGDDRAMDGAAEAVERSALPALQNGRVAELERWLDALGDPHQTARPRLVLARAWVDLIVGDPRSIPAHLDALAEDLGADAADADLVGEATALRAHVSAIRGDTDEAIRVAEASLPHLGAASRWTRGNVLVGLGAARHRAGDLAAAASAFADAAAAFDGDHERHGRWNALQGLGDTHRLHGDLDAAVRAYDAILEDVGGAPLAPVHGLARIGLGKVALERYDLAVARDHIAAGLAAGGIFARGIWIDGFLTRAVVERCLGDLDAAAATLATAATYAARYRFARAVARVATFQAALAVQSGALEAARAWRAEIQDAYAGAPRFEDHQEHATLIRLALAERDFGAARERLARCRPTLEARGVIGPWLELAALEARLEMADGRPRAAERVLANALGAADQAGFVRPFLQDGDALVPVLESLAAGGGAAFARHVLARRVSPGSGEAPRPSLPEGAEPLTDREVEVYRLLVVGASNKAIARALDVSVNTIKTHLRAIYAKTNVSSRAQLLARLRAEATDHPRA